MLLDVKTIPTQALVVRFDEVFAGFLAALDHARIARLARLCRKALR